LIGIIQAVAGAVIARVRVVTVPGIRRISVVVASAIVLATGDLVLIAHAVAVIIEQAAAGTVVTSIGVRA
jgi:hypothetical protein